MLQALLKFSSSLLKVGHHARIGVRQIDDGTPVKIGSTKIKLVRRCLAVLLLRIRAASSSFFSAISVHSVCQLSRLNDLTRRATPRMSGSGMKLRDLHAHFELAAAG